MLGSETQSLHVFSHTWKIHPKNKHPKKHDHIQTQTYNMLVIVELLYGTWRKRESKRE
jgi:hypothetical protein